MFQSELEHEIPSHLIVMLLHIQFRVIDSPMNGMLDVNYQRVFHCVLILRGEFGLGVGLSQDEDSHEGFPTFLYETLLSLQ